jgi:uncharacterized protein (TIGR03790 family)
MCVSIVLLFPTSARTVDHAGFPSGEPIGGMQLTEDGLSGQSLAEIYAALANYSDVLVIRNLNSADSMTIADYFASQRNISWAHVCNVTTSPNEQIDGPTFAALANQVKSCINAIPPSTAINFLVTTKGVPLGTWRSPWENSSSVDSELALVGGPYEGQIGRNRWLNNPYYDKFVPFTRARWGFYIVTRLTAFTVPEALGLVDKATEAIGHRGRYVLDIDPGKDGGAYQVGNDWMRDAAPILTGRGFNVTLDETYSFLTNYSGVAGYSSWGSNDGAWYTAVNPNSGFESDADLNGVPDGWFYTDPAGTANITMNATVRESGSWSLNIVRPDVDGNATSVSANVSILPERRYFLMGSANYTTVNGGRGLFLQLKAYDSFDNLLWNANGSSISGTSRWRGFPQLIYEPIENATKLAVSIVFAEANGTSFIDNIRLIEIRPHNGWIPGSLAETAVSTGARTFTYGTGYGQSLVADLIRDGVTGVKGYVYEPYLTAIAHSDILYDAYTRGYTLAESYMMASQIGLSWMDAIMGDPKLAPYNRSYLPDLTASPDDIFFSNPRPNPGETIDIDAAVHNVGYFPAVNATVSFYLGGTPIGSRLATVIDGASTAVSMHLNTTGLNGWYDICVFADSPDEYYELDETNNVACSKIGVVTTYTIHLTPGHRFVSFPLLPANETIESVLSTVAGCFDYVRYFDALDPVSPWKVFMPGRNPNSLLRLDNSMGFWINVTSDCDLTVIGVRPDTTTIPLHPGWNMVGFPSMNASYAVADLKAALGMPSVNVEAFDAMAAPYYLRRVPDSYAMTAGEGYWVFVPSTASWIVPG